MTMQRTTLFIAIMAFIFTSLSATDWKAYRKARELFKEKRYEEAIKVWQQAKVNAQNDKDDAFYMKMAAQIALRNLKDKAQAVKLIESIKSEERRNVELMNYLPADEIIIKFKDTDFSKYPEDIQLSANYRLANAFYNKKMFKEALAVFDKAIRSSGENHSERGSAALKAGNICMSKDYLDETKAENYYRKSLAASSAAYAWRCEAVIRLTSLLLKQNKAEEAVKIQDEKSISKANPFWKVQLSLSYADTLAAAGQNAKAVELLNSVVKYASDSQKKIIQQKIDKISESML